MKSYFEFDKNNERVTNELRACSDRFIIRTTDDFDPIGLLRKEILFFGEYTLKEKDYFPEASVFIYQLKSDSKINVIDDLKDRINALQHSNIVFIGTLYRNNYNQYQIYTGNLFIQFIPTVSLQTCEKILRDSELLKKRELGEKTRLYFVEPIENQGSDIFAFAKDMCLRSEISICTPEIIVKRKTFKNKKRDGISLPAPSMDWALEMIKAKEAWKYGKGKGIKICIIDDGVDLEHSAFRAINRSVESIDLLDSHRGPATHKHPSEMHGTACASIACSNDPEAPGIAPEADLLVIRTKGLGSVLESEAIILAVDRGADIISCSWGPSDGIIDDPSDDHYQYPLPAHTRLALKYATSQGRKGKGCLVFFAAGNGNEKVINDGYASDVNVMAIGSVNKEQSQTLYTDDGYKLFCCFPSSELKKINGDFITQYGVKTADRLSGEGYSEGDYFSMFGGTSASAPGMAGAAALMLSLNPDLNVHEARALLERSCDHPRSQVPHWSPDYGFGYINLLKLLQNTLGLKNITTNNMSTTDNNTTARIPISRALHIALNYVDAEIYGSQLTLNGCENDATFYHFLSQGFEINEKVLNEDANRENVLYKIQKLIDVSVEGDFVFITYAGHGSQVTDISGDEIKDNMDETLVLYNGMLIDDEIDDMLAKFKKGVNVIWISDSCHSGTITRAINIAASKIPMKDVRAVDPSIMNKVLINNRAYYEEQWGLKKSEMRTYSDNNRSLSANVLSIAAVQDDQYAGDAAANGLFTGMLKQLYEQDKTLSYEKIIAKAKENLDINRQPRMEPRGPNGEALMASIFFRPSAEIVSDSSKDTPDTPPVAQESKQRVFYGERLLIGSEKSHRSLKNPSVRGTRTRPKNIIVSGGTIAANTSRSDSISNWDEAYQIALAQSSAELKYIEPDITSAINADPADEDQTRSGEYLATYPHPNKKNPAKDEIIWHLGDDHSQLGAAFEMIKHQMRSMHAFDHSDRYNEDHREDFPLIAHIDTGILIDHPTTPLNFRYDLSNSYTNPEDKKTVLGFLKGEQQGHGHATLTLLAGNRLTGQQARGQYHGYLGAFPFAQVASLKISETVVLLSGRKFAKAVDYAIEIGADVITMSMAGTPSLRMIEAVNRAYEAGVVIVSAAGNTWHKGAKKLLPKSVMYPARCRRVIGVTGVTYNDTPYLIEDNAGWKNRAEGGKYMQTCFGPEDVMDTMMAAYTPNITWASKKDNDYFVKSGGGTSSATPQVAAAVAMWLHLHRDKLLHLEGWQKVEAVRKALFESADGKLGKLKTGNGILKAKDALLKEPNDRFIQGLRKTVDDTLEKGWLHGVIGMFKNRSIAYPSERVMNMLSMEIEQLLLLDPDLHVYHNHPNNYLDLKNALLRSHHASNFLKEVLSQDAEVRRYRAAVPDSHASLGYHTSVLPVNTKVKPEAAKQITIQSSGQPIRITNLKNESELLLSSYEIDIEHHRSVGQDLTIQLPQDYDIAYLIITIDESGQEYGTWHYPSMLKKDTGSRNIFSNDELWKIKLNSTNRNVLKKAVKFILNSYRILNDQAPSEYQGLVYKDMSKPKDGWKGNLKKNNKIIDKVVAQKGKVILLLHGLFSSTEFAFQDLIESKAFKDVFIKGKNAPIILGYNMPTIRTSISQNATDLLQTIADIKLDHSNLYIIAHSRGCLVARKAFTNKVPMYLAAGPHLGTPMARIQKIPDLLNAFTNMTLATAGRAHPIFNVIGYALKYLAKSWSVDGISDMAPGSEFIESLDQNSLRLTVNQKLVGTNYISSNSGIIIDKLLDQLIFSNEDNDIAVPMSSALSLGNGNPIRYSDFDYSKTFHLNYYKNEQILATIASFLE